MGKNISEKEEGKMKDQLPEIYIREKRGVLITNSLDVAEKFGKRHDRVLRAIRDIIEKNPGRGLPNFGETSYLDESNRRSPMFEMTRTGMIF